MTDSFPKPFANDKTIRLGGTYPKLLRYLDAANQMSVSLNHLRGLIDAGHLTSIKVGHRARRVLASEIEALIKYGIR